MANYHSDEWVFQQLQRHYTIAQKHYPTDQIFGIFVFGSQNYHLDDETSDIDTQVIIIPPLHQALLNSERIYKKIELDNGEFIFFLDIRDCFCGIAQQIFTYTELLFTKFYYVNDKYSAIWHRVKEQRENIMRHNPNAFLQQALKESQRYHYHLYTEPHERRLNAIQQYGYDPKQLYYHMRIYQFVNCYLQGMPYESCFDEAFAPALRIAKDGNYSKTEALHLSQQLADKITQLVSDAKIPPLNQEETITFLLQQLEQIYYVTLEKRL